MKGLYPEIEPYHHEMMAVDQPHQIYVEECGNPNGLPVIFIHGGPGAGCSAADRRFFDPDRYRIILFDQRGCGRSRPLACISDNTTQHLIADIERIREQCGVDKWVVFGGSWGSTLSLAYAQAHPERALGLILRGIFLATKPEIDYLHDGGMARFYPDEFEKFRDFIPEDQRHDMGRAYYDLMRGDDKALAAEAARHYIGWEMAGVFINPAPGSLAPTVDNDKALGEGLIECHYLVNGCFFQPNQLMSDLHKINHLPCVIVHGRYDMLCAVAVARQLHQGLPKSELHITQTAGHASRDPGTLEQLVSATDRFADLFTR